MNKIFSDRNY